MKNAYFVSDIHFGKQVSNQKKSVNLEVEKKKFENFKKLIHRISEDGDKLFLVGDVFDYWMEYKEAIPKSFFKVLVELDSLVKKGVEVFYLSGNHDFALGDFFNNQLKIKTFHNSLEISLIGKSFIIAHGDKILPQSLFNKILNSPMNQSLFKLLHPTVGLKLMRWFSSKSHLNHDEAKKRKNVSRIKTIIESIPSEKKFDYFICGHLHLSEKVVLSNGITYVNLGDWLEPSQSVYGKFDGQNFYLKTF